MNFTFVLCYGQAKVVESHSFVRKFCTSEKVSFTDNEILYIKELFFYCKQLGKAGTQERRLKFRFIQACVLKPRRSWENPQSQSLLETSVMDQGQIYIKPLPEMDNLNTIKRQDPLKDDMA